MNVLFECCGDGLQFCFGEVDGRHDEKAIEQCCGRLWRVSADPSKNVCILITKFIQEELGNLFAGHVELPGARSALVGHLDTIDLVLESLVSESGSSHLLCLN